MELSRWPIWSNWFPGSFAPHYSQAVNITDEEIMKLDLLNLTKTIICSYLFLFGLILRASHLILLPVVAIAGSPVFLIYHFVWVRTEIVQ